MRASRGWVLAAVSAADPRLVSRSKNSQPVTGQLPPGNGGADLFLFTAGGHAQFWRITDFNPGHDHIALFCPAMTLDDLTISQARGDTLITVDDITLRLSHVTASNLQAADFALNDTSGLTEAIGGFFDGWQFLPWIGSGDERVVPTDLTL